MNPETLNSELVRENLLKKIIYFDELESTNDYAKKNKTGPDTLIIASTQTGGMGRFNRSWFSAPGNLTFTITKSLDLSIDEIHLINFYSSYILYKTLKDFLSSANKMDFSLKWPNDVLLNGKKISGLLLEISNIKSDVKDFIIGIGINVNQENFPEELSMKATSLKNETGVEVIPERLLVEFIKNFYSQFSLVHKKRILMNAWISNSNLIGKKIDFKIMNDDAACAAIVMSIDFDGGLQLKFADGNVKKFYSGEISLEHSSG